MDLTDHYERVRERNDYQPVDGAVGPIPATERRRFVAIDEPGATGSGVFDRAADRRTLVTTGVGMTGPPHLGTVGQVLTAVELQRAGLDVQFVIADLEPYHGGVPLERVQELAERYRTFIADLGFDPDRGRLRTQSEARDVMHTAQLLAPYYDPDSWADGPDHPPTEWEQAVGEAYESTDDERTIDFSGATSEAASTHSAVLHGVDFLHPLYAGEYEQIVLSFGVDEHHLTRMARQFRDAAPVDSPVAGLYTRMLPGFDGMPKMSKSIPGSGISLGMDSETIRERIGGDGGGDPAASPVFQAMCLASRYDADRLDRIETACAAGGDEWERARAEYADSVVDLAERWQSTAE
ncbi:nucleotidyl transferase family protein [Halosimplex sp. J119]